MARTVVDSGTQTATLGTEHTLRDETANEGEVFDATLDLGNLVAGETLEVFVYEKVLAAGTLRRVYYATYTGAQDEIATYKSPIIEVPPLTVKKEWKLTIKQTGGTGRAFDWTICK